MKMASQVVEWRRSVEMAFSEEVDEGKYSICFRNSCNLNDDIRLYVSVGN